jgi:predicted TIM-barrel fold metal-dependent hydrolase
MIIDCHVNCGWDISNLRKNLYPTEQSYKAVLHKMSLSAVDKAVILPFPSPGGQFGDAPWYDTENNYLVQAVQESKKLTMFPGVNPADNRSVDMIKSLAVMHETKGLKFSHQIPMKFDIDKLIGHRLMNIVEENNLIMMVHIGTGKERGAERVHTTLDYGIKVACKYPHVTFIFCHLGRLHRDLFDALDMPNVYTDTAGLALQSRWNQFVAREPLAAFKKVGPVQIIEKLVDFGYEDKILFGSDEPYTTYRVQLDHIMRADIGGRAKDKMLGENMEKLLGGQ